MIAINKTHFNPRTTIDETLVKFTIDRRGVSWKVMHEWEHPELAKIGTVKASTLSTSCTTHIYSIDRLKSLLTQTHCKDETALLIKEAFQAILQSTEESISKLSNDQLIDLLEQTEIRKPYSETDAKYAHFAETYRTIGKKFPNLSLEHSEMSHRLGELSQLNLSITDYTDEVFADKKLLNKLSMLNEKMNTESDHQKKKQIQQVVADLLLACSLVPSRHISLRKNACYQEIIEPMCVQDAAQEIDRILDTHEQLFAVNQVIDYRRASYLQRILLLSLLSFRREIGVSIKNDKLFKAIYQRSDLVEWMFTASGSVEQQFLNTCIGASKQQQVLGHVGTIAGLTIIGKQFLEGVKQAIMNHRGKDRQRALQQVEKLERKIQSLEGKIGHLTEAETVDPKVIKKLSHEWGKIFQETTLLTDLGAYSTGIAKPIKNGWLASCFLMFFPLLARYIVDQVKGLVTGKKGPSITFYFGGATSEEIDRHFNLLTDHRVMPTLKDLFSDNLKDDLDRVENKSLWFKNLWALLFRNGGQVLHLEYHGIVIRACRIDDKKVFLLSDPKVDYYQVFNEEGLEKLFHSQKSSFA